MYLCGRSGKQRLSVLPEVTLTTSLPYNLEIGGTTVSKGGSAAFSHERDGYKTRAAHGLQGQSERHAAMIRLAGLGIVMKNSSDEMKEIADYVTDSNETEGAAKVIENFIYNDFPEIRFFCGIFGSATDCKVLILRRAGICRVRGRDGRSI